MYINTKIDMASDDIFLLLFLVSFICLIVGLIKPKVFSRFIKGEVTRGKIGLVFGGAIVVFFVSFGITADVDQEKQLDTRGPSDPIVFLNEQTAEKVTEQKPATKIQEQQPVTQNKQPKQLKNNKKTDYGDRKTVFIGYDLEDASFEKAFASPTSKFFGINVGRYGIDNPADFDSLYNPDDGLLIFPEVKAVKISAAALQAAYERNPIEADEKYRGKMLEVTGHIGSIEKATIITGIGIGLKTGNGARMVLCALKKSEKNKAAKLQKGQFVVVRGEHTKFSVLDDLLGHYNLKNCIIKSQ